MTAASFDNTDSTLRLSGAGAGADEAHGLAVGALCCREDFGVSDWLELLYADGSEQPAELSATLAELLAATAAALEERQMRFQPLLPDDAASLERRAEALADWCHGFLCGLGVSGVAEFDELSEEAREILADLGELTRAGVEAPDDEEQDREAGERAYSELVEFVRVGVQTLFEELAAWRANATTRRGSLH